MFSLIFRSATSAQRLATLPWIRVLALPGGGDCRRRTDTFSLTLWCSAYAFHLAQRGEQYFVTVSSHKKPDQARTGEYIVTFCRGSTN